MTVVLHTPRLQLRVLRESDRDAFAALLADPEVMADAPRPLGREEADRKFDRYVAAFLRHGFSRWAVESAEHRFLGFVGVMPSWQPHPLGEHVEIGWRLVRRAWGRGYAAEAARAALVDVHERLGLAEVLSYTAPDNLRSQAVMARLGLQREPARDFTRDACGRSWTSLTWVWRPGMNGETHIR